METKYYQGHIMLFGIFRIRREFAFFQELSGDSVQIGAAYVENASYAKRVLHESKSKLMKRIEPFLRNLCTIKWIESEPNPKIHCYY